MGRLDNKVAIVTGSTSGMGMETAKLMAEEGAKVTIAGRREEKGQKVVEEIKANGGEAIYVKTDTSKPEDIKNLVKKTVEEFGTVDIAYGNAGAITFKDTMEIGLEEWNRLYAINVTANLILAQEVAPIMKEKGEGYIVITGSIAGTAARWGLSAYTTTKHAVHGLTKALARDLGPEIRVNAILPGAIDTEMLDSAGGADGEAVAPMKDMSPLGRIGSGREIGEAVIFLATPQSSFITGQLLRVDGGVDA